MEAAGRRIGRRCALPNTSRNAQFLVSFRPAHTFWLHVLARAGVQIGRRLACVAEVSRRGGPGGDSDRRTGQEVAIIAFIPYILSLIHI